ncbi:hypothetical protein ACVW0A_006245 [Pseudomonas sp. TE3610]
MAQLPDLVGGREKIELWRGDQAEATPIQRRTNKADNLVGQAMARCNKCRSRPWPRCAARAALDLKGATETSASTWCAMTRSASERAGGSDVPGWGPQGGLQAHVWIFFGVLEIERRPRGASRAEPGPTFVATCHGLTLGVVSLVGQAADWGAGVSGASSAPPRRSRPAPRRRCRTHRCRPSGTPGAGRCPSSGPGSVAAAARTDPASRPGVPALAG